MLLGIYSPRQDIREVTEKKMKSVIGSSGQGEAPRATPIHQCLVIGVAEPSLHYKLKQNGGSEYL